MNSNNFVFWCFFLVLAEIPSIISAEDGKLDSSASGPKGILFANSRLIFELREIGQKTITSTSAEANKKHVNGELITNWKYEHGKSVKNSVKGKHQSLWKDFIKKCGFGIPLIIPIYVTAPSTSTTAPSGTPDARS